MGATSFVAPWAACPTHHYFFRLREARWNKNGVVSEFLANVGQSGEFKGREEELRMPRGVWSFAVPERVSSPRRRCAVSLLESLPRAKTGQLHAVTHITSPGFFPQSNGGALARVAVTGDSIPSRTTGGAFELHREAIHGIC